MIRLALLAAITLLGACPKPPTSAHCVSNTELQWKRIDDYNDKYQHGKPGEPKPSGAVYWSRYYLETARFVLTGKGIDGSGGACTAADHDSKDYKRLTLGLAEREKKVKWMESERGVTFVSAGKGGIVWSWVKDGQPVANNDANTL